MVGRLAGRRAFVTGAGGGIGAAIARLFAAEGAVVGLADIDPGVMETAEGIAGARGFTVDVADRSALHRAVDAFAVDGLDVMVNNAVMFHYAKLSDTPREVVDRMLDVGLKGTFWGTQAATPHLVARGGGAIINLSSMAVFIAIRETPVYSAIKGGYGPIAPFRWQWKFPTG